jgi:Fur family ferric uptake transcriptional regulator
MRRGSHPRNGSMLLAQGGAWARASANRASLLTELTRNQDFISAQGLHERVLAGPRPMGLTTVYRILRELDAAGLVDSFRDRDGERLYRIRPDGPHRHYIRCRACARSVDIRSGPVEQWAEAVGRDLGFTAVEHVLEFTGVCSQCAPTT